ncbi:hypothetical protein HanPSC8_Chr11g0496261 [Helianthus annuus]|nr:hypothetical protein HanPSC8_Chr11g0496261 [Helianthus annuus]
MCEKTNKTQRSFISIVDHLVASIKIFTQHNDIDSDPLKKVPSFYFKRLFFFRSNHPCHHHHHHHLRRDVTEEHKT